MAENKSRVLLVEDTRSLAVVYEQYLRQEGYEVVLADCGQQALAQLLASPPRGAAGSGAAGYVRYGYSADDHRTAVALLGGGDHRPRLGGCGGRGDAPRCLRFLTKPFDSKRLCATVRNALKHQQLSSLVAHYRENFERSSFFGFIGASMSMQAVYRIIESAAPSKATVFITGESGTGKEVCAEAIHQCSPRSEQPFIALNCAAIPHDLMESEIFGHVKGSFTGAQGDRKGAASLADGGTLFLDEICEMDLDLQSKLLRFIQTGTVQRVGSGKLETVDVRFICATNRDPLVEVKAGRFREDLYYRLHVIPLTLPPLRERGEDILLLARTLLQSYAKEENKRFKDFDVEAARVLLDYPWPGNVRELQNVVRNIVVLNDKELVSPDILPPPLNGVRPQLPAAIAAAVASAPAATGVANGPIRPLWLVEKR